jgi:cell division protein FtsI/penicillin-binding protein 2
VCCFYRPVQHLFVSLDLSQAIKHDEYAGLAAETHVSQQVIHAERGMILDANNEVLAHNIPVETVVADATHLSDVQSNR